MASWATPNSSHVTGEDLSVTDVNTLASNEVFLYQRPYALVYNTVATSIPNASATQITLGGTTASGYGFSVSSNNLVVPLAGLYSVSFSAYIETGSGAAVAAFASAFQNGTEAIRGGQAATPSGFAFQTSTGAGLMKCNASDTIGLFCFQNSGSAGQIGAGSTQATTFIHAIFMGSQ